MLIDRCVWVMRAMRSLARAERQCADDIGAWFQMGSDEGFAFQCKVDGIFCRIETAQGNLFTFTG